jgi:putative ABC transport system permease protein
VFISCVGLFGLSLLSIRQRTKEIGVRKVLGAGVWQVSGLVALAAGATLIIAIVTVGFQAIKAARANPVDSLRVD